MGRLLKVIYQTKTQVKASKFILLMLLALGAVSASAFAVSPSAFAGSASAGDSPKVFIIAPQDGSKVTSPVKVWFGLSDWGIAPAGIEEPNTGHMHLIINAPPPPLNEPISGEYLHFGKGQIETLVELPVGVHTLQAVLGDWSHVPVANGYSEVIQIEVVPSK